MKSMEASVSVASSKASRSLIGGKKGRSCQRTYTTGQELIVWGVVYVRGRWDQIEGRMAN